MLKPTLSAIAQTHGYMVDIYIFIFILAFVLNMGIKTKVFLASIIYLLNIKIKTTSFLEPNI